MVGEDDTGVDGERTGAADAPDGVAQQADVGGEQHVTVPFQEIDGEKGAAPWNSTATEVGHRCLFGGLHSSEYAFGYSDLQLGQHHSGQRIKEA